MSTAFLFPGQAIQDYNMLHSLPDNTIVKRTIEEASDLLKFNVLSMDTSEKIKSGFATIISEVSVARAIISEAPMPDMLVGHSIGALSAAVTAGIIDFKDALEVVRLREELMQNAYPEGYGMGIIFGFEDKSLKEVLEDLYKEGFQVYIAAINSGDKIVIIGNLMSIEKIFERALRSGAIRVELININGALEREKSDIFSAFKLKFESIKFRVPAIPYVGGTEARVLINSEEIKRDLMLGAISAVGWNGTIKLMYELGTRLFIELAPKPILCKLVSSMFWDASTINALGKGFEDSIMLSKKEINN